MADIPASSPPGLVAQKQKLRHYRARIFVLTWLTYAGYYFCRKNFSVAMPLLKKEMGFTDEHFTWIIFAYSCAYMVGQFLGGMLSDRFGPRLIVSLGMAVVIGANVAMGLSPIPSVFLILGIVNGGAQSTGWPGTLKNMAPWFGRSHRGVVMAWWGTCYVLGSFVATRFASWCIGDAPFVELGWQRAFFFPPVVLACVLILYSTLTRNNPSDVKLPELDETDSDEEPKVMPSSGSVGESRSGALDNLIAVLSHSSVWVTGAMYFLLKLTRYAILFWTPLYLVEHLGMTEADAGNTSSWYELFGFVGAVCAGYASDKLFNSRRFPVGSIMLIGLAIVCYLEPTLVNWGTYGPAVAMGLMGFMTYGPDTLMTGAGAMDIGTPRRAATAAGVINGMGSCGQLLSPFVVTFMKEQYGWESVFYLFVICALLGALLLATKWNHGVSAAANTAKA